MINTIGKTLGVLTARRYAAVNIGLFVVIFGCMGAYILLRGSAAAAPTPMPLISQGVPVYASSATYPATNANDNSYDTVWRSNGPAWIAYDLSSVSAAQRAQIDVVWYANCCSYDNTISGTGAYNIPGSYTIEANAAAGGGGSAPNSGWVTLATVVNNTYHSRQHMVNLSGYNWVRMNITAIDGSPGNTDAAINLEVRDASNGTDDDWIFYGDSITEGGMPQSTSGTVASFSQLINAQVPANFPVEENGGIGYQTTTSALTYIDAQLALFPGKYVGLSYGTNDANGGCGTSACLTTFYNNYVSLVQKVLALGKIPIVPTIPWGCTANLTADVPLYNNQIQTLYTNFPQIVHGPDLYAYFNSNQSYISGNDCIHPSGGAGMGAYRQQWVNAMLANVYQDTVPVISNVAPGGTTSVGSTITWTTDKAADSQVEYGTTAAYGSSSLSTAFSTSHSVTLSNLAANTLYHYRVKSRDAAGTLATGSDNTFTTLTALSSLHAVGNKLYDANNQPVTLHGVDKSGSEYACIQGWGFFDPTNSDTSQAVQNMKAWTGLNTVRIPMNEDCWLGINNAPAGFSGANYQNAIKSYVDLLVANNIYPILDLHWTAPGTTQSTAQTPMPDEDHAGTFWTQVATAYKSYPSVIFDVFNEPYPDNNGDTNAAWTCWQSGGTCNGVSYQAAGMQELVTDVRNTGATNLIMLGGVQYSNALTQWLAYKPTDPLNNLAASWHMYGGNTCSSQTCWDQAPDSVAAQVPLVAGEFGENYNGSDCTTALDDSFLNWMDAKGASYLAWQWDHWSNCLDLVTDAVAGTPTGSWGTFYKNRLAAIPTASINAAPSTVSGGGSTTLNWTSTNAASCTASGGWSGSIAASGSQSVSPVNTTTYTITCGTAVASATVTVNASANVPGDCDGDGHVTIIDLSVLLTHYGSAYAACDFNSDGIVNIFDLSILLSHYGT